MPTKCFAPLATVALALSVPTLASAQTATGPLTSDEAVGRTSSDANTNAGRESTPAVDRNATANDEARRRDLLLNYPGETYSVGWRVWAMAIPQAIVGLFAHVQGAATPGTANWGGSVGVATGPEFVIRNHGLDIALGLMYVNYGAPGAYIRGTNDPETSTELITSNLYGLYFTSHFLWGIHVAKWFEIQVGVGLGLGYIGGSLLRSQAYQDGTGWHDCVNPGGPGGAFGSYCDPGQSNHFSGNAGGAYQEPSLFSGGGIPTVIPWVSLPQVGLHFQPHRHFDIRLDGGFAIIGLYGGGSIHYMF